MSNNTRSSAGLFGLLPFCFLRGGGTRKKKTNCTIKTRLRRAPLASARQHPENQKESQVGHSPERTVEGRGATSPGFWVRTFAGSGTTYAGSRPACPPGHQSQKRTSSASGTFFLSGGARRRPLTQDSRRSRSGSRRYANGVALLGPPGGRPRNKLRLRHGRRVRDAGSNRPCTRRHFRARCAAGFTARPTAPTTLTKRLRRMTSHRSPSRQGLLSGSQR